MSADADRRIAAELTRLAQDLHDDLCARHGLSEYQVRDVGVPCYCEVIAKVRADERENPSVEVYARAWDEVSNEAFQKSSDYDALRARVAAAARLLLGSGDITPAGARVLNSLLDEVQP